MEFQTVQSDLLQQQYFLGAFLKTITVSQFTYVFLTLLLSIMNKTAAFAIKDKGYMIFAATWAIFGIYHWTMGFIVIFLPFALIVWAGQKLGFHRIYYYLIVGLGMGILVPSIFVIVNQPIYWVTEDTPFFMDRLRASLPSGLITGAIGGMAIWYFIGREVFRPDLGQDETQNPFGSSLGTRDHKPAPWSSDSHRGKNKN